MSEINEHNNSSNHNIHSHGQMSKTILTFFKKFKNYNNYSPELFRLQNSLLMSIVDTPENYLSSVEWESCMRKVCTCSLKPSSTLFFVQYVKCIIELIVLKKNVSC